LRTGFPNHSILGSWGSQIANLPFKSSIYCYCLNKAVIITTRNANGFSTTFDEFNKLSGKHSNIMRLIHAIISIVITASCLIAAEDSFPPVGQHKVDLLTVGMTKEAEAIGRKLQQSLAADPAWLESYMKETAPKPGEPLPYHQKMGITKDEYATFLEAAKTMGLRKLSDAFITFDKAQGKLTMHIEGVALPSDTFVFSQDGQTMKCSLGSAGEPKAIDQKNEAAPAGAWTGRQWTVSEGSSTPSLTGTEDAYQIKVAIGKDSKRRNLIYLRFVGRRSQSPMDITYILRWPQ
jgi:hypothetical protein